MGEGWKGYELFLSWLIIPIILNLPAGRQVTAQTISKTTSRLPGNLDRAANTLPPTRLTG